MIGARTIQRMSRAALMRAVARLQYDLARATSDPNVAKALAIRDRVREYAREEDTREVDVEIVRGAVGLCVVVDNHQVAGPKLHGLGGVVLRRRTTAARLDEAIRCKP